MWKNQPHRRRRRTCIRHQCGDSPADCGEDRGEDHVEAAAPLQSMEDLLPVYVDLS